MRRVLGGSVSILGTIGGGFFGEAVKKHLSENKIKANLLVQRSEPCLSEVLIDAYGQGTTIPIRVPPLRKEELAPLDDLSMFSRVLMGWKIIFLPLHFQCYMKVTTEPIDLTRLKCSL